MGLCCNTKQNQDMHDWIKILDDPILPKTPIDKSKLIQEYTSDIIVTKMREKPDIQALNIQDLNREYVKNLQPHNLTNLRMVLE